MLKEMRIAAGLSQAELATLSGVNYRSLQDYEQGHKSLASAKAETILRISTALGCSMNDLMGECMNDNQRLSTARRYMAYQQAFEKRKASCIHFPVIVPDDRIDMSRIYPTKQLMVKSIVDDLRQDNRVSSLILFGSSITMACHKGSDLDFAIKLSECTNPARNEVSEKLQLNCNWGADILWMDHLKTDERIYMDIMKGLVLI